MVRLLHPGSSGLHRKSQDLLVLRADATSGIGMGHVMRCMALASAWVASGGEAVFLGTIESEALRDRVMRSGFHYQAVGDGLAATLEVLGSVADRPCWVTVDGYHFATTFHKGLERSGYRVLSLHDGPTLPTLNVSAVLAQDLDQVREENSRLVLAGPAYRLLRPEFMGLKRDDPPSRPGSNVLLTFGGADTKNVTTSVLDSLAGVMRPKDHVTVLVGPLNQHVKRVRVALENLPCSSELLTNVTDMVALYKDADLAISAAGGTAWEMAASGLPAVLLAISENQQPTAAALDRSGAAISFKAMEPSHELGVLVERLLADRKTLEGMSGNGPKLCDGRGALRVCEALRQR